MLACLAALSRGVIQVCVANAGFKDNRGTVLLLEDKVGRRDGRSCPGMGG